MDGTITLSTSGGTLASCTQANNSGVVTFSNCTFAGSYIYNQQSGNGLAATYAMTASTSDAISATSSLSVTGPGTASQLVFSVQPTGVANSDPATAFTTPAFIRWSSSRPRRQARRSTLRPASRTAARAPEVRSRPPAAATPRLLAAGVVAALGIGTALVLWKVAP